MITSSDPKLQAIIDRGWRDKPGRSDFSEWNEMMLKIIGILSFVLIDRGRTFKDDVRETLGYPRLYANDGIGYFESERQWLRGSPDVLFRLYRDGKPLQWLTPDERGQLQERV